MLQLGLGASGVGASESRLRRQASCKKPSCKIGAGVTVTEEAGAAERCGVAAADENDGPAGGFCLWTHSIIN
jgi:hypothetical protein